VSLPFTIGSLVLVMLAPDDVTLLCAVVKGPLEMAMVLAPSSLGAKTTTACLALAA